MSQQLRHHVEELCVDGFGGRSRERPGPYARAAEYIHSQLRHAGFSNDEIIEEYVPGFEELAPNIYVEVPGGSASDEVVIIGAHYDNIMETPGADDNASAVAVTMELAEWHRKAFERGERFDRRVRYILFTNEEPPYFRTDQMGSLVHARGARARGELVYAMIAVEMVGYFSDEPGSQTYPDGLSMPGLPNRGNFVAVVTRLEDSGLEHRFAEAFRRNTDLPIIAAAFPAETSGISWSDHASFWEEGIPAAMITDTSFLRNPHYHEPTDTPDTLDYERMAEVFAGMQAVVRELATAE